MKWSETDNDDVIDMRGASPSYGGGGGGGYGMRLGGGGIAAAVVVVIVARLFGIDVTGLFNSHHSSQATSTQPQPRQGPDADAHLVSFVKFVMKDVQNTFDGLFKQQNLTYRHAKLVLFTSEIDTGCGRSSSAIGPFYCPPDEKAYIDLSFYQELRDRFGAPGELAEAYVLAHEMGHHLQKLMHIEEQHQGGKKQGATSTSVKIELQADCFAGVWAHSANARGILEVNEVKSALDAAAAIGDDRLQRQSGRTVNPETWTHGSSEQRVRWFTRGFDSGSFDHCDTFNAAGL